MIYKDLHENWIVYPAHDNDFIVDKDLTVAIEKYLKKLDRSGSTDIKERL